MPHRDRPEGGRADARRRRPDAPLPELRPRALDAPRRESARRSDPLHKEGRSGREVRARGASESRARYRVQDDASRREGPRSGVDAGAYRDRAEDGDEVAPWRAAGDGSGVFAVTTCDL